MPFKEHQASPDGEFHLRPIYGSKARYGIAAIVGGASAIGALVGGFVVLMADNLHTPRVASTTGQAAARAEATAAAKDEDCDRQTWPYISRHCADKNRKVRVISTDRLQRPAPDKPPSVSTETPSPTETAATSVARTAEGPGKNLPNTTPSSEPVASAKPSPAPTAAAPVAATAASTYAAAAPAAVQPAATVGDSRSTTGSGASEPRADRSAVSTVGQAPSAERAEPAPQMATASEPAPSEPAPKQAKKRSKPKQNARKTAPSRQDGEAEFDDRFDRPDVERWDRSADRWNGKSAERWSRADRWQDRDYDVPSEDDPGRRRRVIVTRPADDERRSFRESRDYRDDRDFRRNDIFGGFFRF